MRFVAVYIFVVLSAFSCFGAVRMQCQAKSSGPGGVSESQDTSEFKSMGSNVFIVEPTFNFPMTSNTRLSIQIRALKENGLISYAGTFSEIALQPLGRIENSFYEKIYPGVDKNSFSITKSFTDLKLDLSCAIN